MRNYEVENNNKKKIDRISRYSKSTNPKDLKILTIEVIFKN